MIFSIRKIHNRDDCHFKKQQLSLYTIRNRNIYFRVPLSSTPPQFNTSVPHRKAAPFQLLKSLSSTTKTPQFTTTPSVPHQKPLSSTNPPQFHT